MCGLRADTERAKRDVDGRSSGFFALPHKGGFPRVFTLCSLLVSGSGGFVGLKDIKRAVEITNRHSPLKIAEIKALKSMLEICYIERLAALAERQLAERKLTARAERDAAAERVNLSLLKFDAYVAAYMTFVESEALGKFSALCLENGIDTAAVKRAYAEEKARRSSEAAAAWKGIREASEKLTDEALTELYAAYDSFAEKCAGFTRLPARDKLARMEAFAGQCKRKKEDEIAAARAAEPEKLSSALEREMPSGYLLGGILIAAFLMGAIPAATVAALKGGVHIAAAALSLPVIFAAISGVFVRLVRARAERMGNARERQSALSEFSADVAAQAPYANPAPKSGNAAEYILAAAFRLAKALDIAAPVFATALLTVAPALSAFWLLAVFAREIAAFAVGMRQALAGRESASEVAAKALKSAARLPAKAAESAFALFKKPVPAAVRIAASLLVSTLLTALAAVLGGSPAFYAVAAAFALSPLAEHLGGKRKVRDKESRFAAEEESERVIADCGAPPALSVISCGDYVSIASERGGGRDVMRGKTVFEQMRLYAKGKDGNYVPFKFVPPAVFSGGKAVNNALCLGNTFAVETCGFDGGKRVTVTAHGGGDFFLACVHLAAESFEEQEDDPRILKSAGTSPVYIAAAASSPCTVSTRNTKLFTRNRRADKRVVSIEARTEGGKVTFAFCGGADKKELSKTADCLFRDGFFMRGEAFSKALSKQNLFTPAVCDLASFALHSACRYDGELAEIFDTSLPLIMCVLRGEGGLNRLRRRLKRLSLVRGLDIPFNVAVVCFDGTERFLRLKNGISRIFAEYGLDKGGQAVCLDCAENRELFSRLERAAVRDEDVRRALRLPCLETCGFKRTPLPVELPPLVAEGASGGVSQAGEGIYASAADAENTLAFGGFGCTSRADGSAATFDGDCLFTGEANELCGLPAESVTLGEGGRVWSLVGALFGYCAFSGEASRYVCTDGGLYAELAVYLVGKTKVFDVKLSSPRKTTRKVRVMLAVRPVIGESLERTRHCLELGECERGVCAYNRIAGRSLFLETDAEKCERALSSDSFADENGVICRAENISGGCAEPALAISAELKVRQGECARVRFALSESGGFDFSSPRGSEPKPSQFISGDKKLDLFAEALRKQVETSLEYVSPGGDDYAEKLVKCAALLPESREKMRENILAACENRFEGGDALLRRRGSRGERASRSGAALFLPLAVAKYIDCTDDRDILFERRRYLESVDRRTCRSGAKSASVLEHCLETLRAAGEGELSPYLGADGRLTAIAALTSFMPLVRDSETRLKLAEIKTRLLSEVKSLVLSELSPTDLSLVSLVGAGKPSASLLMRRVENATSAELVPLSAALLEKGETEPAFSLFERINPVAARGDTPFMTAGGGLSPDLGVTPALAYMLLTEGFYGCKTRGETVVLQPSLPAKIKKALIKYRDEMTDFKIDIDNEGSGKWRLFVDGISYNSASVKKSAALGNKNLTLRRG